LLGEIEEKKRTKREEAIRLKEEAKTRRQALLVPEGCDVGALDESRAEDDEDLPDDEMVEDDIDEVGSAQCLQLLFLTDSFG
jgi:hypothetical protein